ncbi:MAG: MBL fold metallo-hydrolase [Oscillospiraceae bacterium]|nr:MBL fold metallo-hydrolase [Oscillospiraceae bacterium]
MGSKTVKPQTAIPKTSKLKKRLAAIGAIVSAAVAAAVAAPSTSDTAQQTASQSQQPLTAVYIDVGQGDSEFIRLPNGDTILIDAGEPEEADNVIAVLKQYNVTALDYVIATHPHEDHIGGMAEVLNTYPVENLYMPNATQNTAVYKNLISAAQAQNLKVQYVTGGMELFNDGNLTAEYVAPNAEKYSDLNNYSAVLRIAYGTTSFLFTGDAEKLSEEEILSKGFNIQATVLKVGHHGSDSSSCADFLNAVNPTYAVISCGLNNKYGHPSPSTISALQARNIQIFRTDLQGTITAVSDGSTVTVTAAGKD